MRAVATVTTAEVIRPFLWVAGLGFSTGFLGFMAVWPYLAPAG
ncbi:MAG TPA: hypothetical protein VF138_09170 [Caulobacteraceae bacterium]